MGVSLQNISFATEPAANVTRIRVQFEYSDNNQQAWSTFSYVIPDDMFDIRVEDREVVAAELVRLIAIGKGHIDEEGNIV